MDLELDRFLPYRLSLVSNSISQAIAATYEKEFDLSVNDWRVMAVLGRFPDATATELIGYTATDKVTVSRAVKRLRERGLVEGTANHHDRRSQLLQLTEAGNQMRGEIIPRVKEVERKVLAALDAEEREQLDRLLERLQEVIGALDATPSPP